MSLAALRAKLEQLESDSTSASAAVEAAVDHQPDAAASAAQVVCRDANGGVQNRIEPLTQLDMDALEALSEEVTAQAVVAKKTISDLIAEEMALRHELEAQVDVVRAARRAAGIDPEVTPQIAMAEPPERPVKCAENARSWQRDDESSFRYEVLLRRMRFIEAIKNGRYCIAMHNTLTRKIRALRLTERRLKQEYSDALASTHFVARAADRVTLMNAQFQRLEDGDAAVRNLVTMLDAEKARAARQEGVQAASAHHHHRSQRGSSSASLLTLASSVLVDRVRRLVAAVAPPKEFASASDAIQYWKHIDGLVTDALAAIDEDDRRRGERMAAAERKYEELRESFANTELKRIVA